MATSNLATKIIAGVTVVDTPVVRAAQGYARAHSEDFAFNHVMRSWILGVVVYQELHAKGILPQMDLEAHAISAIFHDLGWDCTGALVSQDKRFEVDGAEAARAWIEEEQRGGRAEHWDEHRIQLVWDAIALHTTGTIAMYKQTVVKVCAFGVRADIRGPNFDKAGTISWDVFNAVNEMYPRLDLADGIRRVICGFCRAKPTTTYGQYIPFLAPLVYNFQVDYGREFVDGYKPEGSRLLDAVEKTFK
ncbi:hypothetical protein BGZ61DRAFT_357162 [Ilyonectria robusta]|uniref:uncharacterized protein n=1 Tax=Ilyonectria robusta TaxID=1079257 RepID=UPI001E8CBFCD|nr:uncharacterized protein BGZ61DRAFT_357162 [Ilyonectria robusta]KAH8683888.1 hypothetical protein BGZ61DRAFT_357162 [Ilyonectria robusta]